MEQYIMKEIGGYLEMDTSSRQVYHTNALALNSGRHCLEYLFMAKEIKKLYIPDYMCYTAGRICEKYQCEYTYYPIQRNFLPNLCAELKDNEYVYIVNYYGQLSNDILLQLVHSYGNVIVDNVQAFFQTPLDGIDTIYSCRKYFGVSDGAYLYTTSKIQDELDIDFSYNRMRFVLGRYEKDASSFFHEASYNNAIFDKQPVKRMSKLTENMLKNISYNEVKEKREHNFAFLHRHLKEINELTLVTPEGPFMYPFYVNDGVRLREKLIEKKIYIPRFWDDVFHIAQPNSAAWQFTENILPLPCDQRYGKDEMDYIINHILIEMK